MNKPTTSPCETFCIVPWTHTFISPQSERRLCCASREKSSFVNQYIDAGSADSTIYSPVTLESHWNGEFLRGIRRKMLAGEKISECEVCNDQILNLSVYRDWFTKALFPHKIKEAIESTAEDGSTSMQPISFDYRIHNTCNFKCRMCGEQLSSSWEQEKRLFNDWSPQYDFWMTPEVNKKISEFQKNVVEPELINAVEKKQVEEIYWVGGEPLVWNFHWSVMQRLVEIDHAKNVFIRYNTNLSHIQFKGVNLFSDLLPHFKGYLVCASIDGVGKTGEWIRTGLDWSLFLKNFKEGQASKGGKSSLALDVTLTLPGLFSMKEMFDLSLEIESQIFTKLIFAFDPQVVLSPLALPKSILHPFLDELIAYMQPRSNHNNQSLVDTLIDLKKRPTFAELYPNTYKDGFINGRRRQRILSERRFDGVGENTTLEKIYSEKPEILSWWTQ